MKEYTPHPIDTASIEIQNDIRELAELLARNSHDNWAAQRMKDGWVFGNKRDDALKQHPCLIPYEELPESEKEYDRITSIETLKAIIALGFKIAR